jgi:hypothetical protein
LGILVHQDFINGGGEYPFIRIALAPFFNLHIDDKNYKKMKRPESSRIQYFKEMDYLMNQLHNTVSLCLWTPFNECWGQFDAKEVYFKVKDKDDSRLIDHASGWVDHGAGDANSFHIYFTPFLFPKYNKDDRRPIALTEFGGYSMRLPGHSFNMDKFFGYRKYYNQESFDNAVAHLYENRIYPCMKNKGLSAIIYTEVSDVEDECNGLLTYDREVIKVTPEVMKAANAKLKY